MWVTPQVGTLPVERHLVNYTNPPTHAVLFVARAMSRPILSVCGRQFVPSRLEAGADSLAKCTQCKTMEPFVKDFIS